MKKVNWQGGWQTRATNAAFETELDVTYHVKIVCDPRTAAIAPPAA